MDALEGDLVRAAPDEAGRRAKGVGAAAVGAGRNEFGDAAQVVEVTNYPSIAKWVGLKGRPKDSLDVHYPPGTRIVIRREPLHPGAQQRMFDTNGWRHTCLLYTSRCV